MKIFLNHNENSLILKCHFSNIQYLSQDHILFDFVYLECFDVVLEILTSILILIRLARIWSSYVCRFVALHWLIQVYGG